MSSEQKQKLYSAVEGPEGLLVFPVNPPVSTPKTSEVLKDMFVVVMEGYVQILRAPRNVMDIKGCPSRVLIGEQPLEYWKMAIETDNEFLLYCPTSDEFVALMIDRWNRSYLPNKKMAQVVEHFGEEKIAKLLDAGELKFCSYLIKTPLTLKTKLEYIEQSGSISVEDLSRPYGYKDLIMFAKPGHRAEILVALLRKIHGLYAERGCIGFPFITELIRDVQASINASIFTEEKDLDMFNFYFKKLHTIPSIINNCAINCTSDINQLVHQKFHLQLFKDFVDSKLMKLEDVPEKYKLEFVPPMSEEELIDRITELFNEYKRRGGKGHFILGTKLMPSSSE